MAKNKPVISSKFKFHWKIKDFFLYLELNRKKLESPAFKIKCSETTKWCVSLLPTEHYVSCSLTRLPDTDDLNEILVNYNMYVVDEYGEPHFERENTKKLDRNTRIIEEPTFLEQKLLQPEHLMKNSLEFRCEIVLMVDPDLVTKWNFNRDLISLSNDLLRLYETKEASDMILNIGSAEFKVHKFVLQTRCPSIMVTSDSSLAPTPNSEEAQGSNGNSNSASPNESEESLSNYLIEGIERLMSPTQLPVYCLDCDSPTESLLMEGGSCEEVFIIPVCEAILRYIYSGRVSVIDGALRWRLFTIGLRHNLYDLTNKLQDVANECFVVTDMLADRATLLWDLSTYHDWEKFLYPTMTKFMHLSNQTSKKTICVRISMINTIEKGNLLYIFFKLIETEYPITVKLDLAFYHTTREHCLRHLIYVETFWDAQQWHCAFISQPAYLAYGNLYFFSTFTVCNSHETRITRQCFSHSDSSAAQNKSLRQLSTDFTKSYRNPSSNNYYDLCLIPDACTVLAHKLMVYARSPVFREELLSKVNEKGIVTHKVPDTNLVILRKVVEYMYKGMLPLKDFEHCEELRKTAEKLKIVELVNSCNVAEAESQAKVGEGKK